MEELLYKLNILLLLLLYLVTPSPAQLQKYYSPRLGYYYSQEPPPQPPPPPPSNQRRPVYGAVAILDPQSSHYHHHHHHQPSSSIDYQYRPHNYQQLGQQYPGGEQPIYSQPAVVQYQHPRVPTSHAELNKLRYEGNYLQRLGSPVSPVVQQPSPTQSQSMQRRAEQGQYNVPPVLFTSNVLHVVTRRPPVQSYQQQQLQQQHPSQADRSRRYAMEDADGVESRRQHFHDIFMRLGPTMQTNGHVLLQPGRHHQRRLETQKGTNRYKGEVIWTDRFGGHGEQRWDLAQGKL